MTAARALDEALSPAGLAVRRTAALSADSFVLDLLGIVRGQRDVLDGVILLCLTVANAAPRDPRHVSREAIAAPRPTSIGSIANSLGLPFETVRRRTVHLCEDGLCRQTAVGVVIDEAVALPAERLAAAAERMRALYISLRCQGALGELGRGNGGPGGAPGDADAALFRLGSGYLLRMLERLRPHIRSPLDGAVLLAVCEINFSPRDEGPAAPDGAAAAWPGPDRLRRPARVIEVAARLGLPYETIRRHAKGLLEARQLIAVRRGLVVPRRALLLPASERAMAYSYVTLLRMFEGCARLGVLRDWEAMVEASAASGGEAARPA